MTQAQRDLLAKFEALMNAVPGDNDGDGDVDAIDRVLASPARQNRASSLRDSAEFSQFKTALTDGLIANDAAHVVLELVNKLIELKIIRF